MPIPTQQEKEHEQEEREREMEKPNWVETVNCYREVGEAIATFNHAIGNYDFYGVAEMRVEDRQVVLEIKLVHDMAECSPVNSISNIRCGTPICPNCKGTPF